MYLWYDLDNESLGTNHLMHWDPDIQDWEKIYIPDPLSLDRVVDLQFVGSADRRAHPSCPTPRYVIARLFLPLEVSNCQTRAITPNEAPSLTHILTIESSANKMLNRRGERNISILCYMYTFGLVSSLA